MVFYSTCLIQFRIFFITFSVRLKSVIFKICSHAVFHNSGLWFRLNQKDANHSFVSAGGKIPLKNIAEYRSTRQRPSSGETLTSTKHVRAPTVFVCVIIIDDTVPKGGGWTVDGRWPRGSVSTGRNETEKDKNGLILIAPAWSGRTVCCAARWKCRVSRVIRIKKIHEIVVVDGFSTCVKNA